MKLEDIVFEVNGERADVTLNRPAVFNALTMSMYEEISDICDEIQKDKRIRTVLFKSVTERAFAAGTDIKEFLSFSSGDDGIPYEEGITVVMDKLIRLRPITIALIQGVCTGGGAALSMVCDLRYTTPALRFGYPIAQTLGNCLSNRALELLIDSMGVARTKELLLTAKLMNSDEALQAGIVNGVYASDVIVEEVEQVRSRIESLSPLALNAVKQGINRIAANRALQDGAMEDLIRSTYGSTDFHNAVRSFLNKEKPVWSGT